MGKKEFIENWQRWKGTRPKDGDERGSKKGQLENGRQGNHVGPYYTL